MTNKKRQNLANMPIVWKGDLEDDCSAHWNGLLLRAEYMDEDYWWWAVYDMKKGEMDIDSSNEYKERFIGGEATRAKAESVARAYILNRK